jgi:multidrug efflux pump subunit AcrB
MWIVQVALKRPYTFIVLAVLIAIFGSTSALRTPTDIFPSINIPVVSVVWTYSGLLPKDMSDRVIYYYERQLTSQVNGIEHMESESLNGYGVVKVFFQKGVDIGTALAQVTAVSQTVLKLLPAGITPPYVLSYNASSVPILNLALSSKKLPQDKLFDLGQNFIPGCPGSRPDCRPGSTSRWSGISRPSSGPPSPAWFAKASLPPR